MNIEIFLKVPVIYVAHNNSKIGDSLIIPVCGSQGYTTSESLPGVIFGVERGSEARGVGYPAKSVGFFGWLKE